VAGRFPSMESVMVSVAARADDRHQGVDLRPEAKDNNLP